MIQVPKDSRMSLDWVTRACMQNPVGPIYDDKGQMTGNYSTGPVRLSFPNLFTMTKPKRGNGRETYNVAGLWPPGVDITALSQAATACAADAFKQNITPAGFVWDGLESPFHNQLIKTTQYQGYTPGAVFFNAKSGFKPRIVDPNMNDIIDENRVYPGVWAIVAVNLFAFNNMTKGVSIGLQSVMIIADDTNIGGGGQVDPRKAFAGVKIDATVNVAKGFGVPAPVGAAPVQQTTMDDLRRMGLL